MLMETVSSFYHNHPVSSTIFFPRAIISLYLRVLFQDLGDSGGETEATQGVRNDTLYAD